MSAELNSRQREQLVKVLRSRRDVLAADARRDAQRPREPAFGPQAGLVGDRADQSVANLLSGIESAETARHAEELRDIDSALARVDDGSYGTCVRCGSEIRFERLRARPTAQRCLDCQAALEAAQGYVKGALP